MESDSIWTIIKILSLELNTPKRRLAGWKLCRNFHLSHWDAQRANHCWATDKSPPNSQQEPCRRQIKKIWYRPSFHWHFNDFDMRPGTIVAIYRHRWQIESLSKQIKQNFSTAIFLWRECHHHKKPNLGYAYSQLAAHSASKHSFAPMEPLDWPQW